jgi:23S rRNA (adenine2503-C2)-methyltransferase
MKEDIKSINREPLIDWLASHHVRAFRADQILKWVYMRLADGFDQMSDISKNLRSLLVQHFCIARLPVQELQTAEDGTRKYLFALADGNRIETVLIPERNHYTLCVSSQVGCAQGCQFCVTGRGGLVRNLTAAEIISQVWEVRKLIPDPERLTNLVFMGMGEPLANYDNLVAAIEALTSTQWGMKIANRRVTVSTAGLVPRISDLGRDTKVNLAVSLNAVDDDTRSRLMPINRKYPIQALVAACRQYPLPKGRRITVEYILFKDLNDSVDQARKLARLLAPVKAKINLIPFNPYPGSPFRRPGEGTIAAFQEVLLAKHLTSVVRYSKGQDIMAACGQLRAGGHPASIGGYRPDPGF